MYDYNDKEENNIMCYENYTFIHLLTFDLIIKLKNW